MSFAKLIEADIGLALVPFLRMQSLLCFMGLNRQCRKLARSQLLQRRTPITRDSAFFCKLILGMAREVVALSNLAGIPTALIDVIRRQQSLDVLFEPCLVHYLPQVSEEAYHYWDSMPDSPERGLYEHIATRGKADPELAAMVTDLLDNDVRYWKTSRVSGSFIVPFDRPDGSIVVSADMKQVYLVSSINKVRKPISDVIKPGHAVAHGRVLGMMMSATMIPLQGHIVFDGVLVPQPTPSSALVQQALRAYEHAFNTNQLITVLPKIPPPERVPVQVPSSAAAIAALRAKHAAAVQAIVKLPVNAKLSHWYIVKGDELKEKYGNALVVMDCRNEFISGGTALCARTLRTPDEPTLDDYMAAMLEIAKVVKERPVTLFVDTAQGFHLLKLLLDPYEPIGGTQVLYAMPRNPGDRMMIRAFPRCALCGAVHGQGGGGAPLLRCGSCSLVYYCSKKHQKDDWKSHRAFCMRYKMK